MPVTGEEWAAWLLAAAGVQTAPGPHPGLWDALTWLARREGFTVKHTEHGPMDSMTIWGSHRIQVHAGPDSAAAAWSLLHELGHVLMDGGGVHPRGSSTASCRGAGKVAADSVAFVVAARLGMSTATCSWPYVASWAGNDPRARPGDIVTAATARITAAAAAINRHLDIVLLGLPMQPAAQPQPKPADTSSVHPPPPEVSHVLQAAERFYLSRLSHSWVPGYLATRGLSQAAVARWRIGYAPAGWTTLIGHLLRLGHDQDVIVAAGLARPSRRGTLIDSFRDRVMLTIHDEQGGIVGFIGRARPGARAGTPKYLNSPDSPAYRKGDVLFGLHEARSQLAHGATPVLAEGPFDAIAVTAAGAQQYAGLAPCGTAFTHRQAAALARVADLRQSGVLVALDGDRAGQTGAIKAYEILHPYTDKTVAVILPSDGDPAGILQASGPAALCAALQRTESLATAVIDAHIDQWSGRLDYAEGQLTAMRSAAARIAQLLAPEAAKAILSITGGCTLATFDDHLRSLASPELPAIARILPPGAICQILRTADRTQSDCSDVVNAVADAVAQEARLPKPNAARELGCVPSAVVAASPVGTAAAGFPAGPAAMAAQNPTSRRHRREPQRTTGLQIR